MPLYLQCVTNVLVIDRDVIRILCAFVSGEQNATQQDLEEQLHRQVTKNNTVRCDIVVGIGIRPHKYSKEE